MIIACGTGTGFLQSDRLDRRVKFLQQYISFINDINIKIHYSMEPIEKIIKECNNSKTLSAFISSIMKQMQKGQTFAKAWENSLMVLKNENALKQQDLNLIEKFGLGLGTSDINGQEAHCKLSLSLANEQLKIAREEKQKKGKLYRTLGISCGICVALLMI